MQRAGLVNYLLNNGCNVTLNNCSGNSALRELCLKNNVRVVNQ